jgi:octaprenyl-diphosphate synthase
LDDLEAITRLIETSGGIEYAARMAQREKDRAVAALQVLPPSPYRDALAALAEFAVERTY